MKNRAAKIRNFCEIPPSFPRLFFSTVAKTAKSVRSLAFAACFVIPMWQSFYVLRL